MRRPVPIFTLLAALLCLQTAVAQDQQPDVRIAGPPSTKPLLAGLVRAMKQDKNLMVAYSTDLTSVAAVDALATEKVDIALVTRPLTLQERAQYPAIDFNTVSIGMEVVALGVSNDLWNAGVHSISKETMRNIYEGKIKNWQDAGGPNEDITLFDPQPGSGIWEIFAEWLYGDNRKAPLPKGQKVANSQDARDSLEFEPGSISPLAAVLADGARCHALAVETPKGIFNPTPKDVAAKLYPIARPIIAVVIGRPSLAIRAVTEYLTGPAGQALVKKNGDLGVEAVPKPSPNPYF